MSKCTCRKGATCSACLEKAPIFEKPAHLLCRDEECSCRCRTCKEVAIAS